MKAASVLEQVVARWASEEVFTDQTVARMTEIAMRFSRRLDVQGISDMEAVDEAVCRGFVDAPTRAGESPSDATRYFRRVTLRALFRTARQLGCDVGDPTIDIHLPPRSQRSTRPLQAPEIILARSATFTTRHSDHRRAAAWALAEATATTAEIATITAGDFDDASHPATVRLPGTRRVEPRTIELTEWGAVMIRRRLQCVAVADARLVYDGAGGEVARQAAACKLITIILESAGLNDPDVKPESVRRWRAHAHYQSTGDLIGTARLLGSRSLDRTAEALDISWRRP